MKETVKNDNGIAKNTPTGGKKAVNMVKTVPKTYIVRGLMEWQVKVPTGFEIMPYIYLNFEGGHISGYGVAPASLTTDDPVLQKIIESSRPFKQKRLQLLKEHENLRKP